MSDDQKLQQVMNSLQSHAGTTHTDIEKELARVNREMYEHNVELAIRNQTLSLLRKIYEIINTATGVEETSKKLLSAIVEELKFRGGAIALVDRSQHKLKVLSVYRRDLDKSNARLVDALKMLESLSLSLDYTDNFAVDSCVHDRTRLTNSLYDVLTPLVDEKKANELQEILGVATTVLYPIKFAGEIFGVLMIRLDKHVGDLSRAEREATKELIEAVGIAIDRAKLYEDLKSANEKLKALDKLKDEFVSVASHELRTPMTAIKSYLWMAIAGKGGDVTEKQKYYLSRAYSSTDRLIKLVNDMLNISRIESGRMTYDMEKVDLTELVGEVIADVKPRADELGIRLSLVVGGARINEHQTSDVARSEVEKSITHSIPLVLADIDKVKEVLFNLIGNSLKFTQSGGEITVEVEKINQGTAQAAGKMAGMVECRVVDNGAGISPDDVEKLFQKFGLIAGSYIINKSDQKGTGLGLYITKSIIEAHGGSITVHSDGVGKGAAFVFTLPVYDEAKWEQFRRMQEGREKIGMIHTAFS